VSTLQPIDELDARRRAKAASGERIPTALEALHEADSMLVDLIGSTSSELLVSADHVREIARRVDAIILGCIQVETQRAAR
jgi:hypothetical protein